MTDNLISKIESCFTVMEDGFTYFFPEVNKGGFSADNLRVIANEIDRRNKAWNDQINAYFEKEEKDKKEKSKRWEKEGKCIGCGSKDPIIEGSFCLRCVQEGDQF